MAYDENKLYEMLSQHNIFCRLCPSNITEKYKYIVFEPVSKQRGSDQESERQRQSEKSNEHVYKREILIILLYASYVMQKTTTQNVTATNIIELDQKFGTNKMYEKNIFKKIYLSWQ